MANDQYNDTPDGTERFPLKPRMEIALAQLLTGATQAAAAKAAGVSRQTVNDWVNNHPEFRAQMARHHNAVHEMLQTRLSLAGDAALTVVLDEVDEGDVPAAKTVLQLMMSNRNRTPSTLPTTAEEVLTADADRHRRERVKRDTEIEIQSYDMRVNTVTPEAAEDAVMSQIDQALTTAEHRERQRATFDADDTCAADTDNTINSTEDATDNHEEHTEHHGEPDGSIATIHEPTDLDDRDAEDADDPATETPEPGGLDAA